MSESGAPLRLTPSQPFDWPGILDFLGRRVIPGLELVQGQGWWRYVALDDPGAGVAGWVHVRADGRVLEVNLEPALARHADRVGRALRTFFDLDLDPAAPAAVLGPLMQRRPGLRMPGALEPFEIAVRAVLGQQVSLAAATTLAGRFLERFGRRAAGGEGPAGGAGAAPASGIRFPEPARVADADVESIARLGMPVRRAQCLSALAKALAEKRLSLTPGAAPDTVRAQLSELPGIGPWTREYLLMRALRDRDAFPAADLVVMRTLEVRTAAQSRRLAERWRPWRAHAVLHLWSASADGVRVAS